MTRRRSLVCAALVSTLTLGCSSSPSTGGRKPNFPEEDAGDEMPPPSHKDAGVDKAKPAPDAGGGDGGEGGGSSGDDAGGAGGSPDAGNFPDAYVRGGMGPFGLQTRPHNLTCKPPTNENMPAAKLSLTGCVDPKDPKKPAAGLIPYDVNSPLWSDGAGKTRYIAIPDDAVIHVVDCMREPASCPMPGPDVRTPNDGHWEMPVGSVLVKNFLMNNKFMETRLFVRFEDGWLGYSYRWDANQTDAVLVDKYGEHDTTVMGPGGKTQDWYFPSQSDCLTCHNHTVGETLGPETSQMNKMVTYGTVAANQIATLEHIGLFDLPVRTTGLTPLPTPQTTASATLELRARSYLHANCAICHRPGGEYPDIDMRFSTPLKAMNLCNVAQNKGDLGVTGAKRMVPGVPAKSTMFLRMQSLMKGARMPQVATSVVDEVGTKLISDWITQTTICP
jgi:hypothetical protein